MKLAFCEVVRVFGEATVVGAESSRKARNTNNMLRKRKNRRNALTPMLTEPPGS